MINPSEIIGFALRDFGKTVTLDSFSTIKGLFDDKPREIVRNGVAIWTDEPTLSVASADAEEIELNDTVFEIDGIEYQAHNRTPPGNGRVDLDLTRDF